MILRYYLYLPMALSMYVTSIPFIILGPNILTTPTWEARGSFGINTMSSRTDDETFDIM